MQEHSHAFLKSLLETPSASGYEQAIQEVVRSWARHYADEVRPGDPVTFALGYRPMLNNKAASVAMDDKVGVWVAMEALRLLHGKPLGVPVYCVSTVQEEIGLRGATTSTYAINPTVGIAIDV